MVELVEVRIDLGRVEIIMIFVTKVELVMNQYEILNKCNNEN